METIDVKAVIAAATQAATVATFNLLKEHGIIMDEQNAKVVSSKPKAKPTKRLPDSKSATISDILSDAKEEARENGKEFYELREKELTIMEYSERSYAVVGDTKGMKDFLKKNGAYRYGIVYGFADNTAKGWLVSKKKFDEACKGLDKFKHDMESKGYRVTIGESLKAINDAYRAEHPREEKEEKQAKVMPIKSMEIEFFEGVGYTPKGTVKGMFTAHPSIKDLWVMTNEKGKESLYICLACTDETNHFLMVAGGKTTDGKKIMDGGKIENGERLTTIANEGFLKAYDKGIITDIHQWQMDALKSADTASYEWMKNHVKEVLA